MFAMWTPGGMEIFVIFVIILLLFGGKKLPELARGLGRGIKEFKKATREIESEIEDSLEIDELEDDTTKKDKK